MRGIQVYLSTIQQKLQLGVRDLVAMGVGVEIDHNPLPQPDLSVVGGLLGEQLKRM